MYTHIWACLVHIIAILISLISHTLHGGGIRIIIILFYHPLLTHKKPAKYKNKLGTFYIIQPYLYLVNRVINLYCDVLATFSSGLIITTLADG